MNESLCSYNWQAQFQGSNQIQENEINLSFYKLLFVETNRELKIHIHNYTNTFHISHTYKNVSVYLQEATGVRSERLQGLLSFIQLEASSARHVTDGNSTSASIDGVHSSLSHIGRQLVALHRTSGPYRRWSDIDAARFRSSGTWQNPRLPNFPGDSERNWRRLKLDWRSRGIWGSWIRVEATIWWYCEACGNCGHWIWNLFFVLFLFFSL